MYLDKNTDTKNLPTGVKIREKLNRCFNFDSFLPVSSVDKFFLNSVDCDLTEMKSQIDIIKLKIVFSFKKNTLTIKWVHLDIVTICIIYYYIHIREENILSYPKPTTLEFAKIKYDISNKSKDYFIEMFKNKKTKKLKLIYSSKEDIAMLSMHYLYISKNFNDAMSLDQVISMNKYLITKNYDEL